MNESNSPNYLVRLYPQEQLIIPECDGAQIILNARETFTYIDPNFMYWGFSKQGKRTTEMAVRVHKVTKTGKLSQIFCFFGEDFDKLCFTEHQIMAFCKTHLDRLNREGSRGTFFLTKSEQQFFVVCVFVKFDGGSLRIDLRPFGELKDHGFDCQHCLVTPQL